MNTTPKTDECIKMLERAEMALLPILYENDGCFDKEQVFDLQNNILAMLNYRLLPYKVISMPENADKEGLRAFLEKHNSTALSDIDCLWDVMKNYPLVTPNDLKNEFWGICQNIESIPSALNIINVKFEKVNYKYVTDIENVEGNYSGLYSIVEAGLMTKDEASVMYLNINLMARKYNNIINYLGDIYGEFRKMTEPLEQATGEPQQISETFLNTLQPYLTDLQQNGFIEDATAQPLKWTATIKKTKGKSPNKTALIDLLCLLGLPDDVIKNRTLLNSLFIFSNGKPLTAQNYTYITDTATGNIIRPIISEYHTELENIVRESKEK